MTSSLCDIGTNLCAVSKKKSRDERGMTSSLCDTGTNLCAVSQVVCDMCLNGKGPAVVLLIHSFV